MQKDKGGLLTASIDPGETFPALRVRTSHSPNTPGTLESAHSGRKAPSPPPSHPEKKRAGEIGAGAVHAEKTGPVSPVPAATRAPRSLTPRLGCWIYKCMRHFVGGRSERKHRPPSPPQSGPPCSPQRATPSPPRGSTGAHCSRSAHTAGSHRRT